MHRHAVTNVRHGVYVRHVLYVRRRYACRTIDPARLNLLNNLLFRVIRPALLFQLRQT